MEDQQVTEHGPPWTWKQCHEIAFDGDRSRAGAQAEAMAESHDMRVDDDSEVHAERIPEHDVRGLSCDASE